MKKLPLFLIMATISVALSLLWNGIGFVALLSLTWGTVIWKLVAPRMNSRDQEKLERNLTLGLIWLLTNACACTMVLFLLSWMQEVGIVIGIAMLFATAVVYLK